MKVTVKTVKGAATSYEVETDLKVADFKKQIEEKQGAEYPADRQKVIFKGVVLKDEQTLAEASVSEQGFLVVMVTKAKTPAVAPAAAPASTPAKTEPSAPAASEAPPASTPAPAAPAAAPAAAESAPAAAAPAAAAAAPADAAAGTPADATEAPAAGVAGTAGDGSSGDFYTSQASALSAGPNLESHVNMLVDMGFERAEVQKAMRAAFNNPDRAVEYLMNGIPAYAQQAPPVAAAPRAGSGGAAATPSSSTAPAASAAPSAGPNTQPLDMFQQEGGGGGGGGPALAFLRNNPQFQGLRQVVQGNPAILQPMLQELGRQNPQLLALINDNQEEFLQMVNEPLPNAEGGEADPALTQMLAGALGEAGMDVDDDDAGVGTIQVTEEEAATIERLQAMGFSREECIQAFFACDKNEDLAMNFLLDSQDM